MPLFKKEDREDYVKDWMVPTKYAEGIKEFVLRWGDADYVFPEHPSMQLVCELVDWQEAMHYIDNSTGICGGLSSRPLKPPFHIKNLPPIISAATGLDIDEDEAAENSQKRSESCSGHLM